MKIANERYVTIKTLPHFGCKGIPIDVPFEKDGKVYRNLQMISCNHGGGVVAITRDDI